MVGLNDLWFEIACVSLLACVMLVRMLGQMLVGKKTAGKKVEPRLDRLVEEDSEAKLLKKRVRNLIHAANSDNSNALEAYKQLRLERDLLKKHMKEERYAYAFFQALLANATGSRKADEHVAMILNDMQEFGLELSLSVFAGLMKVFAQRGKSQEAGKVYECMRMHGVAPDAMMYVCLMNDAIAHQNYSKAVFFFDELGKLEMPAVRTFMTIVKVYEKIGDWQSALDVVRKMKTAGKGPDNLVLNTVLATVVRLGKVDAAASLLEEFRSGESDLLDAISYNTVLKGYAQRAELDKAETLLQQMKSNHVTPSLITMNIMMDCAVRVSARRSEYSRGRRRNGGWNSGESSTSTSTCTQVCKKTVWDYLDELEAMGLSPDRYTCSTLVKGMAPSNGGGPCPTAQLDRAFKVLGSVAPSKQDSMDAETRRLYEVLFNSLLDACVNSGDMNRMGQVFEGMRDAKVPVSAVTFGTLIKAFGNAQRVDRCHECWNEMKRAEVVPSQVTFGCYIDACVKSGELEKAVEIFESMSEYNCEPNTVVYTTLIKGFSRAKRTQDAIKLYEEMMEKGVERSSVTYNLVLDLAARQPAPSELGSKLVQQVLEDMRQAGVQPDAVTYSILIKGGCAVGNIDGAMSLFRSCRTGNRLCLDEVACNALMHACCKGNYLRYAEEVYQVMKTHKIPPTPVTYSILVKSYGRARKIDEAFACVEEMASACGQKPNLYVYTCLVQACVHAGQIQRALTTFATMQKQSVIPDSVAFGVVIGGCLTTGMLAEGTGLAKEALEQRKGDSSQALQPEVLKALLAALKRRGGFDADIQEISKLAGIRA